MFHRVKSVTPLKNYELNIEFFEGVTKKYDVKSLFSKSEIFNSLKDEGLFNLVHVGPGGYGIIWNDEIDLSCDELYENGIIV